MDAQAAYYALAKNNAVVTARINSNGVALDTLTLAGKVSAGDVTSAKLADSFQGAVKSAIEAAVAAVPGTGAPAQVRAESAGRYPDGGRGSWRSDHGPDDQAR